MLRPLLISLTLLGACAGPVQAEPAMWIVRDKDSEIVLFGSVHLLPPGLDWRTDRLDQALAKADDLWFELPVDAASELAAAQEATKLGLMPDGESLFDLLSPEVGRKLTRVAQGLGLSPALLDRMRPWMAEVTLATAAYRKAGAVAEEGVEKQIAKAAPQAERRAFETPAEQIAMLASAPVVEQVASLEETLKELEEDPDLYRRLLDDWLEGDVEGLEREALAPMKAAAPALYERLITARNARWTAELQARLKGSGHTVVVVGAGHLVGEGSVPQRLRAAGYAVEGP